jgi:hypothetical protein
MQSMRKRDPGNFEEDKLAVNSVRSKEQARINAEYSAERSRARNLSKAVRQRISQQSAPSSTNTEQVSLSRISYRTTSPYRTPNSRLPKHRGIPTRTCTHSSTSTAIKPEPCPKTNSLRTFRDGIGPDQFQRFYGEHCRVTPESPDRRHRGVTRPF